MGQKTNDSRFRSRSVAPDEMRGDRSALVTGCAGFIGATLAARLIDDGFEVVGVDSVTDYYAPSIKRERLSKLLVNKSFSFVERDLVELDLRGIVADVGYVFHLAGQPGVRASWSHGFGEYVERNIVATQQLLEASCSAQIEKFVFASSSSVYGNAAAYPCSEDAVPRPFSPYGVTKLAGERLCVAYADNFNVPTVSLRYFTVYGPGQRPDMAFKRMIDAALGGTPFPLYGDGSASRDFTFVEDVVEATIRAGLAEVPPGTVMNISGRETYSVAEILAEIEDIIGGPVPVVRHGSESGDVMRTGGDSQLAHELLAWEPQVSIREGLGRQIEAQRHLSAS
jgi:UDP-glucuronate 4-epimerase